MEENDEKNAVESYVYAMGYKLYDRYQEFVTESEMDEFRAKLRLVEDWLFDDGDDETKDVYIAKLDELKKQAHPIEARYEEFMDRGSVVGQLVSCINSYREAAVSSDPKFSHIDLAEKQKVLNECVEVEAWLREKQQQQDGLPKYVDPILLSADVRKKAEALDRFCRPVMTKPKPAMPATPENAATPQPRGAGEETNSTSESAANGENASPAPGEPMDADKS